VIQHTSILSRVCVRAIPGELQSKRYTRAAEGVPGPLYPTSHRSSNFSTVASSQNSIIEELRQRVARKERATGVPNATYRPRCDAGAGFVPLGTQAAAPHDL
jgi:hypothetical protein